MRRHPLLALAPVLTLVAAACGDDRPDAAGQDPGQQITAVTSGTTAATTVPPPPPDEALAVDPATAAQQTLATGSLAYSLRVSDPASADVDTALVEGTALLEEGTRTVTITPGGADTGPARQLLVTADEVRIQLDDGTWGRIGAEELATAGDLPSDLLVALHDPAAVLRAVAAAEPAAMDDGTVPMATFPLDDPERTTGTVAGDGTGVGTVGTDDGMGDTGAGIEGDGGTGGATGQPGTGDAGTPRPATDPEPGPPGAVDPAGSADIDPSTGDTVIPATGNTVTLDPEAGTATQRSLTLPLAAIDDPFLGALAERTGVESLRVVVGLSETDGVATVTRLGYNLAGLEATGATSPTAPPAGTGDGTGLPGTGGATPDTAPPPTDHTGGVPGAGGGRQEAGQVDNVGGTDGIRTETGSGATGQPPMGGVTGGTLPPPLPGAEEEPGEPVVGTFVVVDLTGLGEVTPPEVPADARDITLAELLALVPVSLGVS